MENKIENGDWKTENGKVVCIGGKEELLQRIETMLRARRGEFYADKDFGSFLYTVPREDSEENRLLALQYARQALEKFDGVFVNKCEMQAGRPVFNITVDGEERTVAIG